MKKPVLISCLHLFIINRIRSIRLELGLSQREVSRILYPDSDSNLLGRIESNLTTHKYTDENLNKLAKAFTLIAKQGQLNKKYTINDFYPPEPLEEKLVAKTIIEIPESLGQTGTLNLLLEKNDSFFMEWHSIKEITDYCNLFAKKNWETTDFTSIVDRAEKANKLIRKSEDEALFKKA